MTEPKKTRKKKEAPVEIPPVGITPDMLAKLREIFELEGTK